MTLHTLAVISGILMVLIFVLCLDTEARKGDLVSCLSFILGVLNIWMVLTILF